MAGGGGLPGAAAPGDDGNGGSYRRHRPEQTLLYQVVSRHYPAFVAQMEAEERPLPGFVRREFEAYLKCGRLEHGFLRVRCEACRAEKLVAFSCKRRGWCPSCGARRMVDTAALLVDEVLPEVPIRQWVLSVPFPLRFLFAREPAAMGSVLRIVVRAIDSKADRAQRTHAGERPRRGGDADPALRQCAQRQHPLVRRTSMCAALRAAFGSTNRQSCRFVTRSFWTVSTSLTGRVGPASYRCRRRRRGS